MLFTDSSSGLGTAKFRLRRTDGAGGTVFFEEDLGDTYSGLGLYHMTCGSWRPVTSISCGSSWGSTCQVDAMHGQGVALYVYSFFLEFRVSLARDVCRFAPVINRLAGETVEVFKIGGWTDWQYRLSDAPVYCPEGRVDFERCFEFIKLPRVALFHRQLENVHMIFIYLLLAVFLAKERSLQISMHRLSICPILVERLQVWEVAQKDSRAKLMCAVGQLMQPWALFQWFVLRRSDRVRNKKKSLQMLMSLLFSYALFPPSKDALLNGFHFEFSEGGKWIRFRYTCCHAAGAPTALVPVGPTAPPDVEGLYCPVARLFQRATSLQKNVFR